MTRRLLNDWLIYCADPAASSTRQPGSLPAHVARALVNEAEAHGILPGVVRRLSLLRAPELAEITADATSRYRAALGLVALLRRSFDALRALSGSLPFAIVKGPTFARTIYPDPRLRLYTDIDALVAPEAAAYLGEVLISIGFRAVEESHCSTEVKWVHRDNTLVMVEVHTDLVHAPPLRNSVRLRYRDIADAPESPAALLLVAVIHGGAGHQYECLQQLADVVQAARHFDIVDEHRRLEALAEQTGAGLAAITGLELAGRVFHEPKCFEIARSIGHPPGQALAKVLMTPAAVTSSMSPRRFWYSWRRQAFRELLLKRSGRNRGCDLRRHEERC